MDFKVGGRWLYHMLGPEGDFHWCLFDYEEIKPLHGYRGQDAFCDEVGNKNQTKPIAYWDYKFISQGEETLVDIVIRFDSLSDLEAIIEMGFKEGFTMGLGNLDEYLASLKSF